jgi:hypothetical protein
MIAGGAEATCAALVAAPCGHVDQVRDDWTPVADPVREDCARTGDRWASLRRCLTCGHIGCCDSSPNRHVTAHRQHTAHPVVRTLQPGQDWVWCYVDEVSMQHADSGWVEVDLFFQAGLGYSVTTWRVETPNVEDGFLFGAGFPLARWIAEMRRRNAAGELGADQRAEIDELPGWRSDG